MDQLKTLMQEIIAITFASPYLTHTSSALIPAMPYNPYPTSPAQQLAQSRLPHIHSLGYIGRKERDSNVYKQLFNKHGPRYTRLKRHRETSLDSYRAAQATPLIQKATSILTRHRDDCLFLGKYCTCSKSHPRIGNRYSQFSLERGDIHNSPLKAKKKKGQSEKWYLTNALASSIHPQHII